MSKQTEVLFKILLLTFCVGIVVWGIFSKKNLDSHHNIGFGRTYNCSYGGRGNAATIYIDFTLIVSGKAYNSSTAFSTDQISFSDCNNYLLNKTFPVAYYPPNPSNAILLITPKDFSRFNIPFPDSLKWVLKYFRNQ